MVAPARPNVFVHLHTFDLRIHDSYPLHFSHSPAAPLSSKITHFLPIYVLDERQLDVSALPNASPAPANRADRQSEHQAGEHNKDIYPTKTRSGPRSRVANFHRTSPYRLKYVLEAVFGLRDAYRRSGGDLLIGYGKPEVLVPQLVKQLQAKADVEGVWVQQEITLEELHMFKHLGQGLEDAKVELNFLDSKTLIPREKLPFDPDRGTPDVYTSFRKKAEGLGVEIGGMLTEPFQTAVWDLEGKTVKNAKVSVGKEGVKLKPLPEHLEEYDATKGTGGWIRRDGELDSIEALYRRLAEPLMKSPPVGGWTHRADGGNPPELHPEGASPFVGDELSALSRLEDYVGHAQGDKWIGGEKARNYKSTRNGLIGEGFSTKLSAFLSTGTLSPKEMACRVGGLMESVGRDKDARKNVYWILFELLWRDYFQFATQHYSQGPKSKRSPAPANSSLFDPAGFSAQMTAFPSQARPKPQDWHRPNWDDPDDPARRWCEGRTGVPFLDANMRELRESGWMSNRGRQNVASFLVKDLYVDWRIGAEFFEMHLIDYDTCSNYGNWQYQAGVGNDARSSRQFNPIKQAGDYDPKGEFVRMWLPELRDVPDEILQTPWLANKQFADYPTKPLCEQPQWRKFYKVKGPGASNGNGHGHNGDGHSSNKKHPHNQQQGKGRGNGDSNESRGNRPHEQGRGGRQGGQGRHGGQNRNSQPKKAGQEDLVDPMRAAEIESDGRGLGGGGSR